MADSGDETRFSDSDYEDFQIIHAQAILRGALTRKWLQEVKSAYEEVVKDIEQNSNVTVLWPSTGVGKPRVTRVSRQVLAKHYAPVSSTEKQKNVKTYETKLHDRVSLESLRDTEDEKRTSVKSASYSRTGSQNSDRLSVDISNEVRFTDAQIQAGVSDDFSSSERDISETDLKFKHQSIGVTPFDLEPSEPRPVSPVAVQLEKEAVTPDDFQHHELRPISPVAVQLEKAAEKDEISSESTISRNSSNSFGQGSENGNLGTGNTQEYSERFDSKSSHDERLQGIPVDVSERENSHSRTQEFNEVNVKQVSRRNEQLRERNNTQDTQKPLKDLGHFHSLPERSEAVPLRRKAVPNNEMLGVISEQSSSRLPNMSSLTSVTSVWDSFNSTQGTAPGSPPEPLPRDPEALAQLRKHISMELLWVQQAINSRKNYLKLKNQMTDARRS